jgi:hypothetical protein
VPLLGRGRRGLSHLLGQTPRSLRFGEYHADTCHVGSIAGDWDNLGLTILLST